MRLVLALLVVAPLLSGVLLVSAAALSPYVVIDLGTFGGPVGTPMDLNETGQVVGTVQTALPDPNYPHDPNLRLTKAFLYFIARALVAKGFWILADDTNPYPNLPNGTIRERDDRRMVATDVAQAGAIPDRPLGQAWDDRNMLASRGWYAQVLYQALATLPSTQPVP